MVNHYKQTDTVITREIAGETLLVPISGHLPDMRELFALDNVSALVWSLLDGTRGIPELVAAVTAEYDVTSEMATADIQALLVDLAAHDLVEKA